MFWFVAGSYCAGLLPALTTGLVASILMPAALFVLAIRVALPNA